MEIYGDYEELAEMVKGLSLAEPTLKKATVSALNKTIVSMRAKAVKMVAKEYNLKQKDIRAQLWIVRARLGIWTDHLEARLSGAGSHGVPLYQFSPTPKKAPSTRRLKSGAYRPLKGIKVMIRRGDRKIVKGAFIARMPSGHVGVFRRKERGLGNWWDAFKGEQKIEELFGPSPLRILDGDKYQIPLDDFAAETLDKNMLHEAEFFLRREGVLPNV